MQPDNNDNRIRDIPSEAEAGAMIRRLTDIGYEQDFFHSDFTPEYFGE